LVLQVFRRVARIALRSAASVKERVERRELPADRPAAVRGGDADFASGNHVAHGVGSSDAVGYVETVERRIRGPVNATGLIDPSAAIRSRSDPTCTRPAAPGRTATSALL
jgi:hypothetical protein